MNPRMAFVVCVLAGCSDDTDAADNGNQDAGSDAVASDAAGDPCSASQSQAISTLGCNGPPPGAVFGMNETGGPCVPDTSDPNGEPLQGSCTNPNDRCAWSPASPSLGLCFRKCEPASTYVSTGDCPTGSRCFTIAQDNSYCYVDCTTDSECTTMNCDDEGGCNPPVTAPDAG